MLVDLGGQMITKKKHSCGQKFYGRIIVSHGIAFCGFCGKEVKSFK